MRCFVKCLICTLILVSPIEFVKAEASHRVELVSGKPIAGQLKTANTYYVIKETINLQGAVMKVPQNCVLSFEGGQFKNGSLIGQDTYVNSVPYQIFAQDLTLSGTFNASESYPEWFEATDDAIKIRKALLHFNNVVLTAKHYVLRSIDENGYGVIIPEGHTLQGRRFSNNTKTDDNLIDFVWDKKYIAAIGLCSNTKIVDLTVHAPFVNEGACISTVSGFQSRITLERVGVSGSYYGLNIQAYLTSLNQCIANYNTIGFYIHGRLADNSASVEGTSITATGCFAVDSKKYGYKISRITYSTFNNCAADGCGVPVKGELNNKTEIGYAYSFSHSKNITINSCGAEYCIGAVKTQNCKNLIFNAPSFIINKRKDVKVDSGFKLSDVINIRYSDHIVFNYMFINASGLSKYFDGNSTLLLLYGGPSSSPALILRNGYEGIRESNIGTEGFVTKSKNLVIQ